MSVRWILLSFWCQWREDNQSCNIYSRRWSRSPLNGLATWVRWWWKWVLFPFCPDCISVQQPTRSLEHMVSTGSQTRSRPSPLLLQSFSVFKTQDKVKDAQFRQQVYYLLSSSFSNVGMAMRVQVSHPPSLISANSRAAATTLQAECQPVVGNPFSSLHAWPTRLKRSRFLLDLKAELKSLMQGRSLPVVRQRNKGGREMHVLLKRNSLNDSEQGFATETRALQGQGI